MKTQNPFTGRSSGSLANVTASTYLGQNILKSKPLEVRNPQSPKQNNVRAILAQAAVLAKAMMAVDGIAKRSARTGRNSQKTARTALLSAILSQKQGVAPNIMLSGTGIALQGSGISEQSGITANLVSGDAEFTVNWPAVIPTGGLSTDVCTVALFDLDSGSYKVFPSSVTRNTGQVTSVMANDPLLQSSNLFAIVMFDSADGLSYDSVSSVQVSIS